MRYTTYHLNDVADSLYERDDYGNAKICFDELIARDSSNPLLYYERGYCKYIEGLDFPGAKRDFKRAIALKYINSKYAYLQLGLISRINNELDSSLFYYNMALEVDPSYKQAKTEKQEILEIIKKGY
jgi:tetratricopeptide (TPR) repeat protein